MSGKRVAPSLSRAAGHGGPRAPVRHVHMGLGNFFRAHQAAYTAAAPDAGEWGIAAFSGRSRELAAAMSAQDGLYTLVRRSGGRDRCDVVSSVAWAHAGDEHDEWLRYLASPDVGIVTLTVTEAAYLRRATGGLDLSDPRVARDVEALRHDRRAAVHSVPGRLVAGLAARRAACAGPLSVVPCDNLPGNGAAVARVVNDFAGALDPGLVDWIEGSVSFPTSMVDRITPRTTLRDVAAVREHTGIADACPVVAEPFTEWVIEGGFPAGRPEWEAGGAAFVPDVVPYERRKLWLLNGAHSLLAYAGSIRGHATVADAVRDDTCLAWTVQWWDEASRHLAGPVQELLAYREALVERFRNGAIRHRLGQIAADGSQKLPVRVLPVLVSERRAGRVPLAATRVLAAWLLHLRGFGAVVTDVRAAELEGLARGSMAEAVRRVLGFLDPELGADGAVTSAVLVQAEEMGRS